MTHIEDNKDPVELQLPAGNRFFIVPGMPKSRDSISPSLLHDPVLYLRDGPTIGTTVDKRSGNCGIVGSTYVVN